MSGYGGLAGDKVSGGDPYYNYTFRSFSTGSHYNGYDSRYDQIEADSGLTKLSLQSYFDPEPLYYCTQTHDYNYPVNEVQEISRPAYVSDNEISFTNIEPDRADLDDDSNSLSYGLYADVSPVPGLSVGAYADFTELTDSSSTIDKDDNQRVLWDMNLESDGDIPTSQEPSDGVRAEIRDNSPEPGTSHQFFTTSNYTFEQGAACGDGIYQYTTDDVYLSHVIDVV